MNKLILIDGSALLHRAYHAMPGLTNSNGQMINAVYGFFSMLLNLIESEKPTHLVIAFDRSKPTIRQSMYAGYHEHRPPMESDMKSQAVLIDELLDNTNFYTASLDGYEGDDVIGTFANQAKDNSEIVIVTGDRDLLQLVNKNTKILMVLTGITKTKLYGIDDVLEKYGVRPDQFVDYKALIGDQSDGYPGVNGIGPKTAANLLSQYDSFESLYKNIDKLPEKIALKLATDAEQAALAKKLARIITDSPIIFDKKKADVSKIDYKKLREGFEDHQFRSLIARLDKSHPELKAQMSLI